MKYGYKLLVKNVNKLYIATFLMETPDTHEYIVEYDNHHFKGDSTLRKVSKDNCMPYEEIFIIDFYDILIKKFTKKAKALAFLINNKDEQINIYCNKINLVNAEINNMKKKIKEDKEKNNLSEEDIKYTYEKRLSSILEKEKGVRRLYKKKSRRNYEADYKWIIDVGKYIVTIEKFKQDKQQFLNILKQDK